MFHVYTYSLEKFGWQASKIFTSLFFVYSFGKSSKLCSEVEHI